MTDALLVLALTAIVIAIFQNRDPGTDSSEQSTLRERGHQPEQPRAAYEQLNKNRRNLFIISPSAPPRSPLPSVANIFKPDPNGTLKLDHETKIKLDILVSQFPNKLNADDLNDLSMQLRHEMTPLAAAAALDVLKNYQVYVASEQEQESELAKSNLIKPEDILNRLSELRRKIFGVETAEALFALDEAQTRYGIMLSELQADTTLLPAERAARIDALRAFQPPDTINPDIDWSGRKTETAPESVRDVIQDNGADSTTNKDRDIGDNQNSEWDRRYKEFMQRKSAILASSMTEEQKRAQIDTLQQQSYSKKELPLVQVYSLRNPN
jgi:lipase chaperone LimK